MTDEEKRELLTKAKTIAVVGLSGNAEKDSNKVARYLISQGYEVVPINPSVQEVLGLKSLPGLTDLGSKADIVDVFRRPQDALTVANECQATGNNTVWFQLGTINQEDVPAAGKLGLTVVHDCCIMREHKRLFNKE